jgi:hypothetical protein
LQTRSKRRPRRPTPAAISLAENDLRSVVAQ